MSIRSLFTPAKWCSSATHLLFSTLGAIWPPLITLFFLTIVLLLPAQAHELYRILIHDDDGTRVVATLFFLAALSCVTSLMGHALIETIKPNMTTAGARGCGRWLCSTCDCGR
jgi:hypothetical protein